jgi:hypothetical protein
MKKRYAPSIFLCGLLAACASSAPPAADTWAIQGTWTDACCCKVPCPCLFGTPATEGFCEGASLFDVEHGHKGDVSLDGVHAVVAYRVGGWTRVYVSDEASADQVAAFESLLPSLLPFTTKGAAPVVTTAAIDATRTETTVHYSADATTVDLALVESASGEPIRLEGLPAKGTPFPQSHGHTQYKSVVLAHRSDAGTFEHTGRNGYVSHLDLEGDLEATP